MNNEQYWLSIFVSISSSSLKTPTRRQRGSHGIRTIFAVGSVTKSYMESRMLKKTIIFAASHALTSCMLRLAACVTNRYQSDNHRSQKEQSTGMGNVIAAIVVEKI